MQKIIPVFNDRIFTDFTANQWSDGTVGVLSEQVELVEVDEYHSEVEVRTLKVEQEIAPHKTATDIITRGFACTPQFGDETEPLADWTVGVEVIVSDGAHLLNYEFRVRWACE